MVIHGLEVYELGQAVWIRCQKAYESGGDVSKPRFRNERGKLRRGEPVESRIM